MLIIGTMEWKSTRETGVFACPNCAAQQAYRLRASRPFLTLYWIPVIPIGGVTEFVQCQVCNTAFETSVLQMSNRGMLEQTGESVDLAMDGPADPNEADEFTFEADLLRILAAVACEDENVTEEEIKVARQLFARLTGKPLSREAFGIACNQVRLEHLNTSSLLMTLSTRRTRSEKFDIVRAIFVLAGVSGQISPGRLAALKRIPTILEMDMAAFSSAVESAGELLGGEG